VTGERGGERCQGSSTHHSGRWGGELEGLTPNIAGPAIRLAMLLPCLTLDDLSEVGACLLSMEVRSWGRWGGRRESGEAPSPHHYHGPYLGIAEEAGLAAGSNRSVVD
jgi:hypothetical protein